MTKLTFQFTPSEDFRPSISFSDSVDRTEQMMMSDDHIVLNLENEVALSIVFERHIRYSVSFTDDVSVVDTLQDSINAIEEHIDTPIDHFDVSLVVGSKETNQVYHDIYEDILTMEKELSARDHQARRLSSGNLHIDFPFQKSVVAA